MEEYDRFETKKIRHVNLLTRLPEENLIKSEALYSHLDTISEILNNCTLDPLLKISAIEDFENQYELLKVAIIGRDLVFAKTTLCRLRVSIGVIYMILKEDFPIVFAMFPELLDIGKTLAEVEDQL